jgi:hypothetical protein
MIHSNLVKLGRRGITPSRCQCQSHPTSSAWGGSGTSGGGSSAAPPNRRAQEVVRHVDVGSGKRPDAKSVMITKRAPPRELRVDSQCHCQGRLRTGKARRDSGWLASTVAIATACATSTQCHGASVTGKCGQSSDSNLKSYFPKSGRAPSVAQPARGPPASARVSLS